MKSTPDLRRRVLEGAARPGAGYASMRGSKMRRTPLPSREPPRSSQKFTTHARSTPRPKTRGQEPVVRSGRVRAGTCSLPPLQKKGPTLSLDLASASASTSHVPPIGEIGKSVPRKEVDVSHEQLPVTDAAEISRIIQRLHAQDPHIRDNQTPPNTTPPGSPKRTPPASTTPPGTPQQPLTPTLLKQTPTPNRSSTPEPRPTKASLLRAAKTHGSTPFNPARFSTPRNRLIRPTDPGASVTPSKAIVSSLDRAIDAHLKQYAMEGKELTPAGQRIKVLCERRFGPGWSPEKEVQRDVEDFGAFGIGGREFG